MKTLLLEKQKTYIKKIPLFKQNPIQFCKKENLLFERKTSSCIVLLNFFEKMSKETTISKKKLVFETNFFFTLCEKKKQTKNLG